MNQRVSEISVDCFNVSLGLKASALGELLEKGRLNYQTLQRLQSKLDAIKEQAACMAVRALEEAQKGG